MGIVLLITAYFVGCFNTGYYLTRIITKKDIRNIGSNVTGATNVARELGKFGFVVTFLGDLLKIVILIFLAKYLSLSIMYLYGIIILTILGHVFPIQLKFKGGKGISVLLGGLLSLNYIYILYLIAGLIIPYLITKNFTISGLITLLILPIIILIVNHNNYDVIFVLISDLLVIYTHRKNINDFFIKIK